MRGWLLGLRPRLLAALLLTSAVTLGVAALALLSPLEQRLRADGESTVLTALGAVRPELAEIPIEAGHLNEAETRKVALVLRRRSQATLTILNEPARHRLRQLQPHPGRARLLPPGAPRAARRHERRSAKCGTTS